MTYDPEKYRAKREKVLGKRKRGIGFGLIASLTAAAILCGLGIILIPQSIAHIKTRNLEDAIFRVPAAAQPSDCIRSALLSHTGIREMATDHEKTRLVITFDRRETDAGRVAGLLKESGVPAVLLNSIDHRQRLRQIEEEAELEAL